jgi:hypothetical protein
MNSIFYGTEKWGQKTKQKLESEKTQFYAQKQWLKLLFKNSISSSSTIAESLRHWILRQEIQMIKQGVSK